MSHGRGPIGTPASRGPVDATLALLPHQLNWAPRSTPELLADAQARRLPHHPAHGIPFDATEASLVRTAWHAALPVPVPDGLCSPITLLLTSTGIPLALGCHRVVSGDDGVFLEVSDAQWFGTPTPTRLPTDTPHVHHAVPALLMGPPSVLVWHQRRPTPVADRTVGAWYVEASSIRWSAA